MRKIKLVLSVLFLTLMLSACGSSSSSSSSVTSGVDLGGVGEISPVN